MANTPMWTRSSYCNEAGCSCVEVAIRHAVVRLRDSKNQRGPVLRCGLTAWSGFLAWTSARQP